MKCWESNLRLCVCWAGSQATKPHLQTHGGWAVSRAASVKEGGVLAKWICWGVPTTGMHMAWNVGCRLTPRRGYKQRYQIEADRYRIQMRRREPPLEGCDGCKRIREFRGSAIPEHVSLGMETLGQRALVNVGWVASWRGWPMAGIGGGPCWVGISPCPLPGWSWWAKRLGLD